MGLCWWTRFHMSYVETVRVSWEGRVVAEVLTGAVEVEGSSVWGHGAHLRRTCQTAGSRSLAAAPMRRCSYQTIKHQETPHAHLKERRQMTPSWLEFAFRFI